MPTAFLAAQTPLTVHTRELMRGITIKGFSNFRSQTVQNPKQLEKALQDISAIIHMPYFKTKTGQKFTMEQIDQALSYVSGNGAKPVLSL